jgi:hypothetical protein
MDAEPETVTVRRDDLELLRKVCALYAPYPPTDDIREPMERTLAALGEPEAPLPSPETLPDGIFGRIELPGWRNHTGWITDEPRFGGQMAVVRDWDGRVIAEVSPGPGCQIVHLPTPLKRPEPRAALPAGPWRDHDPDEDLDDENGPAF